MATRPQSTPSLANATGPDRGSAGGGRAAAFEAAVLPHLDAAYTLASYLTRRGDAAEDIVQEAVLRAYRSFESQRGENIRAWLLAIVRNCFLTWNARHRREPIDWQTGGGQDPPKETDDGSGKQQETPESILIQHEESSAIRALIEEIPHQFREVLVLRDIEDMSYRDIAEITGVPIGTVMSRLARARQVFATAWKGSKMKAAKEIKR